MQTGPSNQFASPTLMCPAFEMRQLRMGSPPQSLADGGLPLDTAAVGHTRALAKQWQQAVQTETTSGTIGTFAT
jgi:hypothetical protein